MQTETFGAGSDKQNLARAEGFKKMVEAAGQEWPDGWVKGEGFVRPREDTDPMKPPPTVAEIAEEYVRQIVHPSPGQRKRYLAQVHLIASVEVSGRAGPYRPFDRSVAMVKEGNVKAWLIDWDRLRHLDSTGFEGAPRVLGYDEQGRQVLSYLEGTVPHVSPFNLLDEQLLSAAELVLAFHDATAMSPLCDGHEVVCHGDLGPHNTVFRGQRAVAIIDWDCEVRPGRRADDFAHAVWCFADLTEATVPVAEQARRARLMCAAYPSMTLGIVVAELIARFHRARDQHAAAGRLRATEVFDRLLGWMGHLRRRAGNFPLRDPLRTPH